MTNEMTDDQIIQLAEHFGIGMMSRPHGLIDNGDGTMNFKKMVLHYAGERIIELVRLLDGGNDDQSTTTTYLNRSNID